MRRQKGLIIAGLMIVGLMNLGIGAESLKAQESTTPAKPCMQGEPLFRYWFLPGHPLYQLPDSESSPARHLETLANLPVLEVDGPWRQVVYYGRHVWVDTRWQPSWNRKEAYRGLERNLFEKAVSTNRRLLGSAKKVLGIKNPTRDFGNLKLYTDVEDEQLLQRIEDIAGLAEEVYFARFGRLPSGNPEETVVLFQERESYLQYLERVGKRELAQFGGHAGSGLIIMWQGKRSHSEILSLLLHEIGHLLNSRSLAGHLPPWLSEGLATRFGNVWIEGEKPRLQRLRWTQLDSQVSALRKLIKTNQLPGIGALSSLDADLFRQHSTTAYPHAGSFIQFLQEDERYSGSFPGYLEQIADGFRPNMGLLLQASGTEIHLLDAHFRTWLQEKSKELDERRPTDPTADCGS